MNYSPVALNELYRMIVRDLIVQYFDFGQQMLKYKDSSYYA